MKTTSILAIIIGVFAFYSFNTSSSSIASSSEGIQFFQGTWDQALNKAKEEKKMIFIDAYASWCGPCKKMKKKTFVDPKVAKFFDKNFINVAIDMEKGEGPMVARMYPINAYPTLLFIQPNGSIAAKTMGFYGPEDLLEFGKNATKIKLEK